MTENREVLQKSKESEEDSNNDKLPSIQLKKKVGRKKVETEAHSVFILLKFRKEQLKIEQHKEHTDKEKKPNSSY